MPAILIYFPCISKSITFPLSSFVTRLLERGHEVTFATSYVLNNKAVTHVEVGAGIRSGGPLREGSTVVFTKYSGNIRFKALVFAPSPNIMKTTWKKLFAHLSTMHR